MTRWDSNSNRQSWRRARWPLDHHCPLVTIFCWKHFCAFLSRFFGLQIWSFISSQIGLWLRFVILGSTYLSSRNTLKNGIQCWPSWNCEISSFQNVECVHQIFFICIVNCQTLFGNKIKIEMSLITRLLYSYRTI